MKRACCGTLFFVFPIGSHADALGCIAHDANYIYTYKYTYKVTYNGINNYKRSNINKYILSISMTALRPWFD